MPVAGQVAVRYFVEEVSKATAFYTEHFGFAVAMAPGPGFAALDRGPLRLLLNVPGAGGAGQALPDGSRPEPGGWNRLQLEVDDVDAAVARLESAGVGTRGGVVDGRGGRQVLVPDPSGNLVELFEPRR